MPLAETFILSYLKDAFPYRPTVDIKVILSLFRKFPLMAIVLYKINTDRSVYTLAVMTIDPLDCLKGLSISGL